MKQYAVQENNTFFKDRQVLTIWSGPFGQEWEGDAFEVYDPTDGTSGWVIEMPDIDHEYCPGPRPRTEENFQQVDDTIIGFINRRLA